MVEIRAAAPADGAHHVFTVERPDGTRVDLPEVRYTLPAA